MSFVSKLKTDYTKYDIQCNMVFIVTMATFWMTLLRNKWTNTVMDDGWVHSLAKALPSFVSNLWWNIVMDAWNLDEKYHWSQVTMFTNFTKTPYLYFAWGPVSDED